MANIVLEFNTSAAQDAKLAKVLVRINAERVAAEEEEFATIEEYLRWVLIEAVKSYIKTQETLDGDTIGDAYEAADSATQAQVEAILFP